MGLYKTKKFLHTQGNRENICRHTPKKGLISKTCSKFNLMDKTKHTDLKMDKGSGCNGAHP